MAFYHMWLQRGHAFGAWQAVVWSSRQHPEVSLASDRVAPWFRGIRGLGRSCSRCDERPLAIWSHLDWTNPRTLFVPLAGLVYDPFGTRTHCLLGVAT